MKFCVNALFWRTVTVGGETAQLPNVVSKTLRTELKLLVHGAVGRTDPPEVDGAGACPAVSVVVGV